MNTPMRSRINLLAILTIAVVFSTLLPDITHARPSSFLSSRQKRVSDQRVAELETLLALARMRGRLVTVPVGFGRVDPARIGRRRRSSGVDGLEKLKRLLQAVARDSESSGSAEIDQILFSTLTDAEDRASVEAMDQLI